MDFFSKSLVRDDSQQELSVDNPATIEAENEEDDDTDASFLFNAKPVGPGRTTGPLDNNEHKRFVRYVLFFSEGTYLYCFGNQVLLISTN